MVPIPSLLLPILVAAALVLAARGVIHGLLPYHRTDLERLPDEDAVAAALAPLAIPPGEYMLPHADSPSALRDPAFRERLRRGPVAILRVHPPGEPGLARQRLWWFGYCTVVGVLAAYVTGRALPPGAPPEEVFRLSGTVAFIAYAVAAWPSTIWSRRSWTTSLKDTFDGLVYGVLTGAPFSWFWPA